MSYQGKQTVNSMALSMFIGSRLMPGANGKPQRKLSEKEAYDKAVERERMRNEQDRTER